MKDLRYIRKRAREFKRELCGGTAIDYVKGHKHIELFFKSFGSHDDAIIAFLRTDDHESSIAINQDKPHRTQELACHHEIGHRKLGHTIKNKLLTDFSFRFDSSGTDLARMENEANFFVACVIFYDEAKLIGLLKQGMSYKTIACMYNVPLELLDFELRMLDYLGKIVYRNRIDVDSGFMGHINQSDEDDFYDTNDPDWWDD